MPNPKGISLHIGLNFIDPSHYENLWELEACHADAKAMQNLFATQGFKTDLLLSEEATREAVRTAIQASHKQLQGGDFFAITFAGHGGQLPEDGSEESDEADGYDESWCLFDGQLLDDELVLLWNGFAEGVRILIISDSCHSGTVSNCMFEKFINGESEERYTHFRYMPRSFSFRTAQTNAKFYSRIRQDLPEKRFELLNPVLLLAACQDAQFAKEQDGHGLFTHCILKAWNEGKFEGNYDDFHEIVLQELESITADQFPNFINIGSKHNTFSDSRPFTI